MTKVRGSKGFDALFSRVFDEPGLKDAVGHLHDDFSSPKTKRVPHVLVDSFDDTVTPAAVVQPVVIAKPVVAQAKVKQPVVPVKTRPPAVVEPSIAPPVKVKQPVVAAPIIFVDDDDDDSIGDFFARKVNTAAPVEIEQPVVSEQIVTAKTVSSADVDGHFVENIYAPEPVVTPLEIEEPVVIEQPAVIEQPFVVPIKVEQPTVVTIKVEQPVIAPIKIEQPAVAAIIVEQPLPVFPEDSADDDDHLIDDFFSRKVKPVSHAPVVTPDIVAQPHPAATVTQAVAENAAFPQKDSGAAAQQQTESQATPPIITTKVQPTVQPKVQEKGSLTEDQGRILMFLYRVAGGLTNVDIIESELGIERPVVREALLTLVTEGYLYLLDKKRMDGFTTNGFTYKLNKHLCALYAAGACEDEGLTEGHAQSSGLSGSPSAGRPLVFSKSLMEVKKVEVPPPPAVLVGAVGAYWEEEGLEESQAQKWCSIFGVQPEQMSQQLEWARFDLETNKRRETTKKDIASWFYDRLMITGGMYPRPYNYQSAAELRAEAMLQQLEHDLSAKAKFAEIEFINALQSFLAYPEAPLYQELLEQVNSFAVEQLKAGESKAAAIDLEALFKVRWGMTSNDPATSAVSFSLSGVGKGQSVQPRADQRLSLAAGWNLFGFAGNSAQAVSHATRSIATLIVSVWGWNNGQWQSYSPTRSANGLTAFEPGMGYWINLKQPVIWTLP